MSQAFVAWEDAAGPMSLDPLRWPIGGSAREPRRSELPADPWSRFANSHFAHLALASMSSAGLDRIIRNVPLCGDDPRVATGQISFYPDRIHLEVTRDAQRPRQGRVS